MMANSIKKNPSYVIACDREVVRVYEKEHGGFIFGWTEVVKKETISRELIVKMKTGADKIFINGVEYKPITPPPKELEDINKVENTDVDNLRK